MNESRPAYEWDLRVMSHIWISHVQHTNASNHTLKYVLSRGWTSHVPHTDESCESCDTYGWVTSLIQMCQVKRTNISCHADKRVTRMMPLTLGEDCKAWPAASHVTHMNESVNTYGRIPSHKWMNYVSDANESCQIHEWIRGHERMRHVTHANFLEHKRMRHFIRSNKSFHPCWYLLLPKSMNAATHTHKSCRVCEWILEHIRMRYIIHKNELFYIWWYLRLPNTWISSHILASRVAYMNESLNTYGWGTSYVRINHKYIMSCG
jgi:hypothetical protein